MAVTSGIYRLSGVSGTMAAGLSANSPIYSWRWSPADSTLYAKVTKVIISAGDTSTAFAAGNFIFSMFVARAFTASDTAGTSLTPTGSSAKLATAYQPSALIDARVSSTTTLTAGTRTLDTNPMGTVVVSDPATAGNPITPGPVALFNAGQGEPPMILAPNEGIVIQANVPGTGTWTFSVDVQWEEARGVL